MKLSINTIILSALCLQAMFLTGCIRDDSGCNPEETGCRLSLTFQYTHNMSGGDLFADQVERLDVFVFDAAGWYVKVVPRVETSGLRNGCTLDIDFDEPGQYSVVAWGRSGAEHYNYSTTGTISDFHIAVNASGDGEVEYSESPLFHGVVNTEVSEGQTTGEKVSMVKHTKSIEVHVSDVDMVSHPALEDELSIRITGSNGRYGFEGANRQDRSYTYLPYYPDPDEGSTRLVSHFHIQALSENCDVRLVCRQPGYSPETFDEPVVELIRAKYTGDSFADYLEKEDNFVLDVRVQKKPGGQYVVVSVRVNDWDIIYFDKAGI